MTPRTKTAVTHATVVGPPDTVRIGTDVREQLITMKRRTGVMNWNVLCRWALCRSLAEPTAPTATTLSSDTAVEMTWKTFIKLRTQQLQLPLDEAALNTQLRAHITRGTQYLVGDAGMRDTPDLIALIR